MFSVLVINLTHKHLQLKKPNRHFWHFHFKRIIDDLIMTNNNKDFEKSFKDVYPEELELHKKNANANVTTFLDLNIAITGGQFLTRS